MKEPALNKLIGVVIVIVSFLLPLFFLPLTVEFYVFNKITLLYSSIAVLLIIWVVRIWREQKIRLQKTTFALPVLGFMMAFLLSTFLQSPNKWISFENKTGIILSSCLLYFIIVNNIRSKKTVGWILSGLILSSVALVLATSTAYLGLLKNTGIDWLQSKAWTPTGIPLSTLAFLLILLPATLYLGYTSKSLARKILLLSSSLLQIAGSVLVISLFADKTVQFVYLPAHFGWQIAVDGLKVLRTAILGAGPGNFISVFSKFKPVGLNNTGFWALKFAANSNEYLNLLSIVGVVGLGFYIWLVLKVIKTRNFRDSAINKILYTILITGFTVQLLIPSNILIWFVIFLSLGLAEVVKRPEESNQKVVEVKHKPAVITVCMAVGIFVLAVFYFQGRAWAADFYFRQSFLASQDKRGIDAYKLQIKAVALNPFSESYHLFLSNTSFALANSMASQKEKELSDQDKANINQLIQQAIQEGKTATNLNPQVSIYWASLADIYRQLLNTTKGADQWAVSAYLEAVRTDPANPVLRIDLGGLLLSLKNYEGATDQFKIAVNLKPDYANGYYNLAAVYKATENWQKAYNSMQQVVALIPSDNSDRKKVVEELEKLKAKLPSSSQEATGAAQSKKADQPKKSNPQASISGKISSSPAK